MDGFGGGGGLGGLSSGMPTPRDIVAILIVLLATLALGSFASTAIVPALLQLSPAVYVGQVWRLVSYPFIGAGAPSFWFLIALLMVFWFGRDIFWKLGRRRFWKILLISSAGAAVAAALVQLLLLLAGVQIPLASIFGLMQGQNMMLTIFIAAFANLFGEATILFMFVLPIKARWFLWLEILIAFVAFLGSKDFAGFIGVATAVGLTTAQLTPGGPRHLLWRWRKQLDRLIVQLRLARLRRRRRFDVFDGRGGDDRDRGGPDRWVH
jgi:hypothetical protein